MRVASGSFGLLAWLVFPQATPATPVLEKAVVHAKVARGSIHVDGMLDEPAWVEADVITDLTQQEPHPGEPTAFRTEVRVLVDSDNIYLGFHCFDPEPDQIAVHTLQRDGAVDGDDHVTVVFDTFLDNRTGYFFAINAAGARQDGLIENAESSSIDWDGIWDGRARRTTDGWAAEIAIPAKTLHFASGVAAWGFNIERAVPRQRLRLRFTGTSLDATLIDMRRSGQISGIESLRQGLGLSFIPYGLIRYEWQRIDEDGTTKPEIGGDLYYNFTPSLTGVLTVNTDFAETEADEQQINLTRFPLFFPEKRAFFLEGSTQFNFGVGLGTDLVPFFSRRVGLFEGRRVPILGGIKLLGRVGRFGIGVVDAYTKDLDPTLGSPGAPGSNLGAGRVTYDASEHLRVGMIVTDGDPAGVTQNQLFGTDLVWQTSKLFGDKNFTTGAWWTRSSGDLAPGDPNGYGFVVDYPNDLWDLNFSFRHLGDALDAKLGFLPRRNVDAYSAYAAYQPRPQGGAFAWARQFFFEFEPRVIVSLDGVTESWRVFVAPFNVVTQHGDHFEANWVPQFERLIDPFEVAEGVVIPAGSYDFTRYRLQAESSEHRPWTVAATTYLGGFYSGHLTQTDVSGSYTTHSGQHRIEIGTENDFGHLPQGSFVERLDRLRWTWSFSPDLTLSALAQYEAGSRILGWNIRLRWTVKPGNDVFVVWNRDWLRTDPDDGLRFTRESDQLALKARWTFRK